MSKFKVGDKVRLVCTPALSQHLHRHMFKGGLIIDCNFSNGIVEVEFSDGLRALVFEDELIPTDPSLEEQLEFAKTSETQARKVFRNAESEIDHWETRIAEIKKAIAERDKPRGRVKYGDRLPDNLYLLKANGSVSQHYRNQNTEDMVLQGNLFYDKGSAQYEAEQRRQRVLGDK